jgi:hypothetical protein
VPCPAPQSSPPPPKIDTGFPWCGCQTASRPYYFVKDKVNSTDTVTCYDLKASKESCRGRCCDFDLFKFELEYSKPCVSSINKVTINGVDKPLIRQYYPGSSLKVTNLNIPFPAFSKNKYKVCVKHAPGCKASSYAVFESLQSKKRCCIHDDM